MTLEEARDRLADALKRAVAEHGRPNSFSCQELEVYYGGPSRLLIGRLGMRFRNSLWNALGREEWGPRPEYANGRWFVQ